MRSPWTYEIDSFTDVRGARVYVGVDYGAVEIRMNGTLDDALVTRLNDAITHATAAAKADALLLAEDE